MNTIFTPTIGSAIFFNSLLSMTEGTIKEIEQESAGSKGNKYFKPTTPFTK